VSYLFYADRINQLTVGVVGAAIATALLPTLAGQLSRGDQTAAVYTQNRAIEFGLLLALPSTAALLVIPFPIISILFQRGEFDLLTAQQTANTLLAYAFGLPGFVLSRTLTPSFHARQDTKTPVQLALVTISVNIAMSVLLMTALAHVGLALSTAIAANVNTLLLMTTLYRRGHWQADHRLKQRGLLILLASVAMAVALFLLDRFALPGFYVGGFWQRVTALAILVGGGMAVYLGSALLLGATRPSEWKAILRRG